MKFNDPDEVLWRYLELKSAIGQPQAVGSFLDRKAYIFAVSCRAKGCPSEKRRPTDRGKRSLRSEGFYHCDECDALWPTELVYLAKGEIQSRRRTRGMADRLHEIALLEEVLAFDLWTVRIYLELYLLNRRSMHNVAHDANATWPRETPKTWTHWRVKDAVGRARRTVQRRLQERGMWAADG